MADNDNNNLDQNQEQDPFAHPIKNNNWWLYIFGGLVIAGIIIWFFIDWSYKNRNREPEQIEVVPAQGVSLDETLPNVNITDTLQNQ